MTTLCFISDWSTNQFTIRSTEKQHSVIKLTFYAANKSFKTLRLMPIKPFHAMWHDLTARPSMCSETVLKILHLFRLCKQQATRLTSDPGLRGSLVLLSLSPREPAGAAGPAKPPSPRSWARAPNKQLTCPNKHKLHCLSQRHLSHLSSLPFYSPSGLCCHQQSVWSLF